ISTTSQMHEICRLRHPNTQNCGRRSSLLKWRVLWSVLVSIVLAVGVVSSLAQSAAPQNSTEQDKNSSQKPGNESIPDAPSTVQPPQQTPQLPPPDTNAQPQTPAPAPEYEPPPREATTVQTNPATP